MNDINNQQDTHFMQLAIVQAQKAFDLDEVPVGALVVNKQGIIIGRGYNQVEKRGHQGAHAEIIAITKACKKSGDWRLNGCWIYVTLEPCVMCMGLILLSRLEGIVYGATATLFGHHLDKQGKVPLYKEGVIQIRKGVGEQQSVNLLKQFFKQKRKMR